MSLLDRVSREGAGPSPFGSLLEEILAETMPQEGLTYGQVSGYVGAVLQRGLREIFESRDDLVAVRTDLREGPQWADLREHVSSTMAWLYEEHGTAAIEKLASEAKAPMLATLAYLAGTALIGEEPVDTTVTPALVRNIGSAGLTLSFALSKRDRAFAKRLLERAHVAEGYPDLDNDEAGEEIALDPEREQMAKELFHGLAAYGATPTDAAVERLLPLYRRAAVVLPERVRLGMLTGLSDLAEQRRISANALNPFLHVDQSPVVISSAALALAGLIPGREDDPLDGVQQVLDMARHYATNREESRAASILKGLLLLGDRRIVRGVGPCWRWLSLSARRELSTLSGISAYAAVIEWMIDWLEECEGDEFGAVAGTLARLPSKGRYAEVVDIHRTFPVWEAEDGQVVSLLQRWSFEEFGERIRPRLLQLAADETPPRVMYDVLKLWGIDHTRRHMAGVFMRPGSARVAARPLVDLLPKGLASVTEMISFVPLDDADFIVRDGDLILCWAIFNPHGPTWSCLGRLPTEDPELDVLFYRMLNPFAQEGGVVATLRGDDRWAGSVLSDFTAELFRLNGVRGSQGESIAMLGGGPPDLVVVPWEDDAYFAALPGYFLASTRMAEFDLAHSVDDIRATNGQPWERASRQREFAFRHMQNDGLIVLPAPERPTTPELILEWLRLVTRKESLVAEFLCYPAAWHGAIDQVSGPMAQHAYSFWQLDDFLSRFRYPVFRTIADVAERQEGKP
jgi:hypothetical protein